MFDLENITQGEAVARLNGLAFIFLPLSFVAVSPQCPTNRPRLRRASELVVTSVSAELCEQTVFGITTLETPAYWYPVAAIPVLLVTICAALGVNRGMTYLKSRKSPQRGNGTATVSAPRAAHTVTGARDPAPTRREKAVTTPEIRVERPRSRDIPNRAAGGPDRPTEDDASRYRTERADGRKMKSLRPEEIPQEWGMRSSSAALGYRVSGVARVDSDNLRAQLSADASPGALRSPSGTLRHT